jgi:hypothetical protein
MPLQEHVDQCYRVFSRVLSANISPKATIAITENACSCYHPSKHHIQFARNDMHSWDAIYEEVGHAVRHTIMPKSGWNYDKPITYYMVAEFFGCLGRTIGRTCAFTHSESSSIHWNHISSWNRSLTVIKSPKEWLGALYREMQNPALLHKIPDDSNVVPEKKRLTYFVVGHGMGYLLAEHYPLPHPTSMLLPLYQMSDEYIIDIIFPHIARKNTKLSMLWSTLVPERKLF